MVSKGHSLKSRVLGYRREWSRSIWQDFAMRNEEFGPCQGDAGWRICQLCAKCRRVSVPFGHGTRRLTSLWSKTLQHTEARIFSRFGWGLTKRIENHGLTRFKANMQRVRTCPSPSHCMNSPSCYSLVKELAWSSISFANLASSQWP